MTAMKTTDIFVESVSDDEWYSRTNLWGDTTVLAGDVFTPLLDIYNEDEGAISTTYSSVSFTFGEDPAKELGLTELDEDNCYWVIELDDYLDDDEFYLEEPDFPESGSAKSPASLACILFGLGIPCLLMRRR